MCTEHQLDPVPSSVAWAGGEGHGNPTEEGAESLGVGLGDPGRGKGLESPGRRTWIPPGGGLGDAGRARTAGRGHTSDEDLETRRVPWRAGEEEGAGNGGCAADALRSPFRPARRSASDCSGLATRPEVDGGTRRSASPAALVSR